ncbi:MAG: DUF3566 domain-containing protein [Firmicutes bacterium]|nr:DUF3566 domain-containing protein [Bacillota bacterium]
MARLLEIKRIGAASVFRVCFFLGLLAGVAALMILMVAGISLQNTGLQLGTAHFREGGALQAGATVVGVVIGGLAGGLVGGVLGVIGAFIYNLLAALVGGIVIKIREGD